jgi:hypothetical protein
LELTSSQFHCLKQVMWFNVPAQTGEENLPVPSEGRIRYGRALVICLLVT